MNEAQVRHDLIDPALRAAGWESLPAKVAVEQTIAPGPVSQEDGQSHNPEFADYVLMYGNRRIAVVEAKASDKNYRAGEAQARKYAAALGVRFAYATNGSQVFCVDLTLGTTSTVELDGFPTPAELMSVLDRETASLLEKICREIPWSFAGNRGIRYYQERAVEGVIKALGSGKKNALVTLATGTGKTFIAYQLCHKLVAAKWTRQGMGLRKPRILFLTDRNILADQALDSFAFAEGDCYRLKAAVDNPPLDRIVYFTLYQTLLGKEGECENVTAGEAEKPKVKFEKFPRDFFDLVIIDECHRGGANDESEWHAVLEYFASASHVGLTATPKCDTNRDTYKYFGKPVYTYSLRQGIEDGFLTPYRVKKCESTIKDYRKVEGDQISDPEKVDGNVTYSPDKIQREHFVIPKRDRHMVEELFKVMPFDQKALVFCATQEHAAIIAQAIREEAKKHGIDYPHYCERVTADDGATGDQYLREFRNSDLPVPTILTTSQKLTTGVDACNVRSIVLMREVKSMVEFKQIIGRGTRLYEGKPYFVIYDFTDASDRFQDDGWDGPTICPKCGRAPCVCEKGPPKPPRPKQVCKVCGCNPCVCPKPPKKSVTIDLWDGRQISATWEDKVILDNEMLDVKEFLVRFANAIRRFTKDEQGLRGKWQEMEERSNLLEELAVLGFTEEKLREIQQKTERQEYDVLDITLDLVYAVAPIKRAMRAERLAEKLALLTPQQRALAEVILRNYVNDGVWTLSMKGFSDLLKQRYGSISEALSKLSFPTLDHALNYYSDIQHWLYAA